ncbi:hypothetical protein [Micromonospora sp. DT47]|uniref:hypothetical protein n=1 Tax=Micromonospora sp. DT47 TaxID=3393431 RepID=UPI003CFA8FA8
MTDPTRSVDANLTVTGALQAGFLSIFPDPGSVPTVSTINFQAGDGGLAAPVKPSWAK